MSLDEPDQTGPQRRRDRKIQSCAECRRLKLRCDRAVPCSSCVRRGLQSLCPTGTVSGSWKGNRTILASTKELHERNEQLSARIRDLETALATLQGSLSDGPHPLLSEKLLLLKLPPGVAVNTADAREGPLGEGEEDEEENISDAFGTLHISTDGSGSFYGASAPSEMLMQNYEYSATPNEDALPANLLLLSNQFPFNSISSGSNHLLSQMRALLPPLKEGWRLCELYFENASWLYRPFSRADFIDIVFTPTYEKQGTTPVSGAQLALLYITMAMGLLVDMDIPAYCPTAHHYHRLARACLAVENVMVDTSLAALYSIFGLCYYLQLSDEKDAWAECMIFQGIMIKMAQSMGLHRDPDYFKLSESAVQRRRRVFWEIYVYDMWQSVMTGRPPGMSSIHIDTKMPTYPEDGGEVTGYHHTKLEFGQEYLRTFLDDAFAGSQKPKYKRILQLDKDLRTRCVYSKDLLVPGLDAAAKTDETKPPLAKTMQRHALFMIREVLLFYLHRGYFARALGRDRAEPLQGTFSPSVLATYRSACGIMACLRHSFASEREAIMRLSWFWSHAASSAVIFAALVTYAPGSLLSSPALLELDQACELFIQAPQNRCVARFLPTAQKMQRNAHDAMARWNTDRSSTDAVTDLQELSVMAGATHLICKATQTPVFTSSNQKTIIAGASTFSELDTYCMDPQTRRLLEFEGAHELLTKFYSDLQQQQQPAVVEGTAILDLHSGGISHGWAQVIDASQSTNAGVYSEPIQRASLPEGGLTVGEEAVNVNSDPSSSMEWTQLMEQLGVTL